MVWQLAEAKSNLGEVMNRARDEGPQFLARQGEEYVRITKEEYVRLIGEKPNFLEALRSAPSFDGLDLSRDNRPLRDIDL